MQKEKSSQQTKIGTEEDIINRLRRLNFDEVRKRLISIDDEVYFQMTEYDVIEFLKSTGWTRREYNEARQFQIDNLNNST